MIHAMQIFPKQTTAALTHKLGGAWYEQGSATGLCNKTDGAHAGYEAGSIGAGPRAHPQTPAK